MGDQVITLEYKADGMVSVCVPVPIFKLFCGFSVDHKITGGVTVKATYNIQQGRLTAAGLSQNGNKLIFPEIQCQSFQCVDRLFTGKIVLFNVFQL